MSKAKVGSSPLFAGATDVRDAGGDILAALMKVRAAKRYACKAESPRGIQAHQDLHDAEDKLVAALDKLGIERA